MLQPRLGLYLCKECYVSQLVLIDLSVQIAKVGYRADSIEDCVVAQHQRVRRKDVTIVIRSQAKGMSVSFDG